jgi:glycosyltransferase involved in cell wall biosynthesis
MQILMLNHNVAWRGGTFFRAYHFGRYLVRRGHSVTLLTVSPRRWLGFNKYSRDGITVVETPDLLWGIGRTGWDPWDILNRFSWLRGKAWDIVHAWDCRPAVILPALFAQSQSKRVKAKLVVDWCDWWGRGGAQAEREGKFSKVIYGPVETYFEEAFRARADGTTVISEALYQRSLGLNVRKETIRILPQGCDTDESPISDRSVARTSLNLPSNQHLVVSVGALTASEAQLFFESVQMLLSLRVDCKVVMIGNHRSRIPPGIKHHSQFLEAGFVSEQTLKHYISASTALLVPLTDTVASRGRWPSKANPFLAAGRVAVITEVGDLARLLKREEAGIVAKCDAKDIVESLLRLFASPSLQEWYENRARWVAEKILAWPIVTDELEHLYQSLRSA